MKTFIIILSAVILSLSACSRKSLVSNDNNLEISHSTVCGWCTGGDSLSITQSQSKYISYKSCDIKTGEETSSSTPEADWNELIALLDMEKFNAIHLNICNVCADGCDARVTIKKGTVSHSISYGSIDNPSIAEIRPFLEKLREIRSRHKSSAE